MIINIGRPVEEMEYPGITICSQGWIPDVVNKAVLKQLEEFIASKHELDIETVRENLRNESLKIQYEDEIYRELYPGSTTSVTNMITSMTTNNPVSDVQQMDRFDLKFG